MSNSGDPPVVLIVDDDDDLREVLELLVDSIGLRHSSAANGAEALASIAQTKPAVILLDLRMPVMDGRAFARELRARVGHEIPIALMSAADDVEASARSIGAEECLAKPFELNVVEAKLRRLLETAPTRRARA